MSRTSSAQSPRSRALPAKLKPNGPGNISGKSVRTSDRHAAKGPSPDTLNSRPTVEAALYDGPHRICPALPRRYAGFRFGPFRHREINPEIGSASCRERWCEAVEIEGGA